MRQTLAAAAMLAVLVAATPASAPAQLKGIGKAIAGKKIDKKIDQVVGGDSDTSSAPQTSATPARNAAASTEITAERLDQFLVAIRPAIDAARKRSEGQATRKSFEQRAQQFEQCRAQMMTDPSNYADVDDDDPRKVKIDKRIDAANATLEKELAKGPGGYDAATIEKINAELQDILYQQQLLMMPSMKKCGDRPVAPVAATSSADGPTLATEARSTFTRNQFGRFRERVGAWVLTQGKGDRNMTFTADEQAALEAKSKDLALLEPFFRDGTLTWSSWGDLPTDWQ